MAKIGRWLNMAGAGAALAGMGGAAWAQVRTVDPSATSVRRDAAAASGATRTPAPATGGDAYYGTEVPLATGPDQDRAAVESTARPAPPRSEGGGRSSVDAAIAEQAAKPDPTSVYQEDDVLGAAENVFGRGAEGLGKAIESVLKKQGRPNAYIGGREVGGSFVAGLRYGSGTMHHKIEGARQVYWTGPSLGFDFGGNGAKTFILVYNLYDSQDLFHRFPAAEGAAYFIGGFNISYMRRGDVVLIPIRLGVGYRIGANIGYMRFSERARVLPF